MCPSGSSVTEPTASSRRRSSLSIEGEYRRALQNLAPSLEPAPADAREGQRIHNQRLAVATDRQPGENGAQEEERDRRNFARKRQPALSRLPALAPRERGVDRPRRIGSEERRQEVVVPPRRQAAHGR